MTQKRLKKGLRAALAGALCVLMAGLCACSTGSGNSSHLESTNPPSSQEGSSNTSVASSGSNKNEWILPEGYDMKKLAEKPEADSGKNGQLYYVDLNALLNELGGTPNLKADFMRFASCMQGILNREKPVMFVEYVLESDVFWYNYLRQEGKTLYGYKRVNISTLDDFFSAFGEVIQRMGLILWDVKVPSTANVSVTVSGIEEWLPVRGDEEAGSLLDMIKTKVSGVEVK